MEVWANRVDPNIVLEVTTVLHRVVRSVWGDAKSTDRFSEDFGKYFFCGRFIGPDKTNTRLVENLGAMIRRVVDFKNKV